MPPTNLLLLLAALAPAADAGPAVELNRDVRPILADACFACHGPAQPTRNGGTRLDRGAQAKRVVIPDEPGKSELFRRISSAEASERMPRAGHAVKLTGRQIGLVKRWIEQGAKWQARWAFARPARQDGP